MSIRNSHKTRLKELLETITFNSQNLLVYKNYTTNPARYPFCFIVSQGLTPNAENGKTLDNRSYRRSYEYGIVLAFIADNKPNATTEDDIDSLEELILGVLQSNDAVNNTNGLYLDLFVESVSAPINTTSFTNIDNLYIKEFIVKLDTIHDLV